MDFARQQRDPTRHMVGIVFVVLLHALIVYALVTGLARKAVDVIKKPLDAKIIEEIKAPPPPPPPPRPVQQPQRIEVAPQTYVPPPDVEVPTTQTAPVISAVTNTPPPEPHVIAPPPPVAAPPAPSAPRPAVRRIASRVSGPDPVYPREAIRAGVSKGRVLARIQVDEKGNVIDIQIVSADPPRVFDRAVKTALQDWKLTAEGEKYFGEVEINFTLKDE